MAYEHVPLTEPELGPAVWKVVRPGAPAPLQGMVARGLAPLPPRDLLVALYQLWVTNVPDLAEQAAKTVTTLPPKILAAGLADAQLPAGVLDFVGRKLPRDVAALEAVVRHPRVADQTLVGLGRVCPEGICDLLSDNQERWLRCPAIVEALYQNPSCRMSVAQRMLELAVREGLDVNLPNIEEIKQALFAGADGPAAATDAATEAAEDEQFRLMAQRAIEGQEQVVARMIAAGVDDEIDPDAVVAEAEAPEEVADVLASIETLLGDAPDDSLDLPLQVDQIAAGAAPTTPPPSANWDKPEIKGDRITQISKLAPMKKIRLALIGNTFERAVLIRDSNKAVCLSAIKSPKVKENEVVTYCANRSLAHDVIRYIAGRREWTKLYAVKLNLVLNPKTPMSAAMGLLNHLHAHDVRKVAHSRNIPSALATAAKRRMDQRR